MRGNQKSVTSYWLNKPTNQTNSKMLDLRVGRRGGVEQEEEKAVGRHSDGNVMPDNQNRA